MFKLFFGLVWTAFTSIFCVAAFFGAGSAIQEEGDIGFIIPVALFLLIFLFVGFLMMFLGAREIIKNKRTDKNGILLYGKIIDIFPSGSYVNGRPELKAQVEVCISAGATQFFDEIIGFDRNLYRVGDFVAVKHFEGDINILGAVNQGEMPVFAQNLLSKGTENLSSDDWSTDFGDNFTDKNDNDFDFAQNHNNNKDDEYIVLNGIRQRRE